jgi:septum site-determining protein MinC
MRLRGRSYLAFALAPEAPIANWLAELDLWLRGSPGFFAGRPSVLDLAAVRLTSPGISHLISELGDRGIRILGIEGVAPEKLGPSLPPLLNGGRHDVIVVGSVGSGAEVVAGGSVFLYGTLRGRVIAGTSGNSRARIFCRRIEAELVAIDGYYRTAVSLDAKLGDRTVEAWLAGETLMIAAME